jgi:hypothetical protein
VPAGTPALVGESASPAARDRVFRYLRLIDANVFPLVPGLDAGGRRLNLVKFIRDNAEPLGVSAGSAEALVAEYQKTAP